MVAIDLKDVSKKYGDQVIFDHFQYAFNSNGCYLLFGPSGCGKTTLLNIIAGLTEFNGSVSFSKREYQNQVNENEVKKYVAYISQDNYFVDYLTVEENLMLCSSKKNKMLALLEQFHLADLKKHYPNELSGGQKQRISIVRALLLEKPVILLDEPSASLDRENKILVFEMLSELKKDHLLIVSSHDEEIRHYCDDIIDFENLVNVENELELIAFKSKTRKKKSLWKSMYQEFRYKHREKKSGIIFGFVIFISCLLSMAMIDPDEKIYSNLERRFQTNQMGLMCSNKDYEKCINEMNQYEIDEIVNSYGRNMMNRPTTEKIQDGKYDFPDYDHVFAIPSNEALFHRGDLIVEGSYFKDKKDILLSEEFVKKLFPGMTYQEVIGETVVMKMYEKKDTFKVCGIVKKPNEDQAQYFNTSYIASHILLSESMEFAFVSNEYAKDFLEVPSYTKDKSVYFDLYFESFSEMVKVYEQMLQDQKNASFSVLDMSSAFGQAFNIFISISMVFVPVLLLCLTLSIIFFAYFERIKQTYKRYNHCVYLYCGYRWQDVYKGLVISEVINKVKILLVSTTSAVIFACFINLLDKTMGLFPFKLFLIKPYLLIAIIFVVLVLSIILDGVNFLYIRRYGWFDLLKERRDLL